MMRSRYISSTHSLLTGFEAQKQCLWIAEGLIGYMTAEEGGNLIKAMYQACAPGSKMVMTCPPTPKVERGQ
jgi:O-methyltransferase involved in polyketide biosynthesis